MDGSPVLDLPLVIIIDDDCDVRHALVSLFTSIGYRVECFENADLFLARSFEGEKALVISDYQMPGTNGIELCLRLRERGSSLPVVLITAFATAGVRHSATTAGIVKVLEKPFDPSALLEVVGAIIG